MFGSLVRNKANAYYVPNEKNLLHVISKMPQSEPMVPKKEKEEEKKWYYYQRTPREK